MQKKTLLLVLTLATIALIVLGYFNQEKSLTNFLIASNSSMQESDDFLLTREDTKKLGKNDISNASFENDGIILMIEKIDFVDRLFADSYIDDKVTSADSLFTAQDAPYPGVLTRRQVCPEKFHPTFHDEMRNDDKKVYYEIFANDRLTYGLCSQDVIAYNAILAYIYCDSAKTIFTVELFSPLANNMDEKLASLIESFSCTTNL